MSNKQEGSACIANKRAICRQLNTTHFYTCALARVTSLCLLLLLFILSSFNDAFANDIKLLDNRFRLDYAVEEVTMVFFREYGSAPVVLVRPDGSKVFQYTAVGQQVTWFDSPTYDMINIKKPMAVLGKHWVIY